MTTLTPRMRNWIVGLGAHIGTADGGGRPDVIVVDSATAEGDRTLRFSLSDAQAAHVSENLTENPRVALGPGGIGSVRAAYQLKGNGRLDGSDLVVSVDEIYCTKPGPEAGMRLDVLDYQDVLDFETSRWTDDGPPR